VQSVKMTLVEGLQAKPLGVKRGGVHWWFRVRPNVKLTGVRQRAAAGPE